jgi:crotonobetainyl-CoA:carnitine CoA-transferase CaiB-like acyl-CoA transferase
MFDAMAEWMTVPLLHGEGGVPFRRIGLAHAAIAPYGVFKTRDGADILIAIQNDREWRVLADKVLGDAALGTNAKFATNPKRVENRAETDAKVAACFASHDVVSLMKQLESGRHRLCARQRLGAVVEACALAKDYGRRAERARQHACTGAAARGTGAQLWTDPGTGRAHGHDPAGILEVALSRSSRVRLSSLVPAACGL